MNRYGGRESFSEKRYFQACKELGIRPLPYLVDVFRYGLDSVRLEYVLRQPQPEEEIAEGEGTDEKVSHDAGVRQESADGDLTDEEEKNVISFLWVLRTDILLRYISLAHTRLPQRIWKVIADVLGDSTQGQIVNRGVLAVDLSNCRLSDSQTSFIVTALSRNPRIKVIQLRGNELGTQTIRSLSLWRRAPSSKPSAKTFMAPSQTSEGLSLLDISNTSVLLNETSRKSLIQMLQQAPIESIRASIPVKSIAGEEASMAEKTVSEWITFLLEIQPTKQSRYLGLTHTHLERDHIKALCGYIASDDCACLDLDLGHNFMGDELGCHVLDALVENSSILHVNLSGNAFGSIFAAHFQELWLERDHHRKKPNAFDNLIVGWDLDGNYFDDEDASVFARILEHPSCIWTRFVIGKCRFSERGFRDLTLSMKQSNIIDVGFEDSHGHVVDFEGFPIVKTEWEGIVSKNKGIEDQVHMKKKKKKSEMSWLADTLQDKIAFLTDEVARMTEKFLEAKTHAKMSEEDSKKLRETLSECHGLIPDQKATKPAALKGAVNQLRTIFEREEVMKLLSDGKKSGEHSKIPFSSPSMYFEELEAARRPPSPVPVETVAKETPKKGKGKSRRAGRK